MSHLPRLAAVASLFCAVAVLAQPAPSPAPGTRLHYVVLSGLAGARPPFATVDVVYGPAGRDGGLRWWQLEARAATNEGAAPLFTMRALAAGNPLSEGARPVALTRYQLRIPETGEGFEYREANTGKALLPGWAGFQRDFLPRRAPAGGKSGDTPETCRYLGQTLSLQTVTKNEGWKSWDDLKTLVLDREKLVGTSRNFKDREGARLASAETNDYTYVRFEEPDYRQMIAAGMNLFMVAPNQEPWVRGEPVFYLREPSGQPALRYPADLYRANYLGSVQFVDEPAALLIDEAETRRNARRPADAAALIEQRTRSAWQSEREYGVWHLDSALRKAGVNLGDFRIEENDFPVWEAFDEAAYYEMKGGGAGIVNEARYQPAEFNRKVTLATGLPANYTGPQLIKFHHALMRGGTRPWGKFWGAAIYGQCNPALAPLALTTAYDMGARYFWFWTSDHSHHVPWQEQLSLSRALASHALRSPRRSIYLAQPKRAAAIALPNGYFLCFKKFGWDEGADTESIESRAKYRQVMRDAFEAVNDCLRRGEDFDITVEDERPIEGYRRVIRIKATGRF